MTTNVSFETAKLLKEKGFDTPTLDCYNLNGLLFSNGWCEYVADDHEFDGLIYANKLKEKDVLAPTIAEVVMWFYENHEIWISSIPRLSSWIFEIQEIKTGNNSSLIDIDFYGSNDYLKSKGVPTIMQSPIEAYEAAIVYALTNIVL